MVKVLINKIFIIVFVCVSVISCSTQTIDQSEREPASVPKGCIEIAATIINQAGIKNEVEATIELPAALPEFSLSRIINVRKTLKDRYKKITESIRDFELHPDLPTNGKTKLLLDPHEGYLAKIMMIRNAKSTIDLSYFIFKEDDSGKALLHELRLAIRRGVKVRILVDSMGSIKNAPFYDDIKAIASLSGKPVLDEAGNFTGEYSKVEAVLFNPVFNVRAHVANWMKAVHNIFSSEENKIPLATFTINRRSHDKILLVDAQSETDSMAIIGGRNIADHYYNVGVGVEHPILDAEIMIKGFSQKAEDGSVQNSLENHYNKIFYYMANKNFEDFLFKTNRDKIRNEFKEMRTAAKNLLEGDLQERMAQMEDEDFLNKDFEDGLVSILNEIQNLSRTKIFFKPNGPQNKKNGNSLVKKMHAEIAKAQKSVDIVSPYFWIPDEEIEFLIEWATQNPERKVRIFSNSITTTNNILAQSVVDATFQEAIIKRIKGTPVEKQIELYSYGKLDDEMLDGSKRYGFLHAKVFIADNKSAIISTSNLDPISRHLNSEVGTTIENLPSNSKNMAKLTKYMDDLQANSTQWGSTEWQQIRKHPKNRTLTILQAFVTKIIYSLNLVPLL